MICLLYHIFIFSAGRIIGAENQLVVEKIVERHGDDGGETEDAGGFDESVVEWKIEIRGNIVHKFVEWRKEPEEPSEKWTDEKGGDEIPGEEFDDADFAGVAFFPGDFGMQSIGEESCEDVGDHGVEPEQLVVDENGAGEESINDKIERGENDADNDIFAGAFCCVFGGCF